MLKTCSNCKQEKSLDDFYKHKSHRDGYRYECKICFREYSSTEDRKKKRRAYNLKSEMSQRRAAYLKSWTFKKKYGITVQDYADMVVQQKERCAICEKHQSECQNGLYVDHNHSTQTVRQLLCRDCNVGIGHFLERTDLLEKAANYLKFHKPKLQLVEKEKQSWAL